MKYIFSNLLQPNDSDDNDSKQEPPSYLNLLSNPYVLVDLFMQIIKIINTTSLPKSESKF